MKKLLMLSLFGLNIGYSIADSFPNILIASYDPGSKMNVSNVSYRTVASGTLSVPADAGLYNVSGMNFYQIIPSPLVSSVWVEIHTDNQALQVCHAVISKYFDTNQSRQAYSGSPCFENANYTLVPVASTSALYKLTNSY